MMVAPGRRSASNSYMRRSGRLVERRAWPRRGTASRGGRAARARRRDAAARRPRAPATSCGLVQPRRKVPEPAGLQHLAAVLVGVMVGRLGIAQRLLQRADRQIGLLRQEQHAGIARQADAPLAERPQARQRAEQRGLAAARRAAQQHWTRRWRTVRSTSSRSSVPLGSRTSTSSSASSGLRLRAGSRSARLVCAAWPHHGLAEGGESVDDGLPVGEPAGRCRRTRRARSAPGRRRRPSASGCRAGSCPRNTAAQQR